MLAGGIVRVAFCVDIEKVMPEKGDHEPEVWPLTFSVIKVLGIEVMPVSHITEDAEKTHRCQTASLSLTDVDARRSGHLCTIPRANNS